MPDGGAGEGGPPVIDGHAHVFSHRMPLAQNAWAHPDYDYDADAYVADLDRHGVSFGVIAAASLYGDYNDFTLDALRRHKRLRATAFVQPTVSLDELRRMADCGVVGVRLTWRRLNPTPDLRAPEYQRLLNRLVDTGMHVELLARASQMPELLPPLDACGVKVVIDHFGGPELEDGTEGPGFTAVLRALENGRTWVKVSASYRIDAQLAKACMGKLLENGGPERLVWGSDAPFVGHEATMDYASALSRFTALCPDPATRRAISDTALRLYFF